MAQIVASSQKAFVSEGLDKILCVYINVTHQIQIIRILNIPNLFWEQVVFPGQRLMFEAVTEAKLEINGTDNASTILTDIIPCKQLHVIEK